MGQINLEHVKSSRNSSSRVGLGQFNLGKVKSDISSKKLFLLKMFWPQNLFRHKIFCPQFFLRGLKAAVEFMWSKVFVCNVIFVSNLSAVEVSSGFDKNFWRGNFLGPNIFLDS